MVCQVFWRVFCRVWDASEGILRSWRLFLSLLPRHPACGNGCRDHCWSYHCWSARSPLPTRARWRYSCLRMWSLRGGRIPGRQPMPPPAWKCHRAGGSPVGPNVAAPDDGRSTRCRMRRCRSVHRSAIRRRPRSSFQWHHPQRVRQRPLRSRAHWLRQCVRPVRMPPASRHSVTSHMAISRRASPIMPDSGSISISPPAATPVACRWSSGSTATHGGTARRRIVR